jgi:D-alanine-D-alanine ligase
MNNLSLKKLAIETLPKLQNKKIYILTGTGSLKRAEKIELLSEIDTYEIASSVFKTLLENGFKKVKLFPVSPDNLSCIELLDADIFINLVEGVGANFVAKVVDELKKTGIPFTGSDGDPLKLTTDKNQTKAAVEVAGVKVAPAQLFRETSDKPDEKFIFPIILKPKRDDGSAGITNDSVVKNPEELKDQLKEMIPKFKYPIMGEQFIDGREFSVTVLEVNKEPFMLPIAEIHFPDRGFHGKWKIYNYAAKWVPGSPETMAIYANAPAKNLGVELEQQMIAASLTSFKVLDLHGYARFDYRVDDKNKVAYFLEANANPSLENTAGTETPESYKALELDFSDFLVLILKAATERFEKKNA